MMFTTISRVKDMNGIQFQTPFSYDRYVKMEKVAGVTARKVEEKRLRSVTL